MWGKIYFSEILKKILMLFSLAQAHCPKIHMASSGPMTLRRHHSLGADSFRRYTKVYRGLRPMPTPCLLGCLASVAGFGGWPTPLGVCALAQGGDTDKAMARSSMAGICRSHQRCTALAVLAQALHKLATNLLCNWVAIPNGRLTHEAPDSKRQCVRLRL